MFKYHYKIEFFFGVGLTQEQEVIDKEIVGRSLQIIKGTVNKMFGGCTLVETVGSWTDPDNGFIYKEPSRLLFAIVPANDETPTANIPADLLAKIDEIEDLIKTQLNQKSVVVMIAPILCRS